ncbi:MAG: polyhydroxyalkanoate synthesis regulator DNA-binding domain-containing protein [Myxococcota bacterium]
MVIKKYGNRRLYDTERSTYITLDELATLVRERDVQVVDAKTGQDLTQSTLAHIILESRGAARLLPVPLLRQLVRLEDDALGEFFGLYMSNALDFYLRMKQGVQMMMPMSPFPMANPFMQGYPAPLSPAPRAAPAGPPADVPEPPGSDAQKTAEDLADLRRELDELKSVLRNAKGDAE